MSTCNRLDLETLGPLLIYAQESPQILRLGAYILLRN